MATLLIWTDDGETLTIIRSCQVEDGDQAAVDAACEDAAGVTARGCAAGPRRPR